MASSLTPHVPSGGVLRKNYLSAIENIAQSIGTIGPVANAGTVVPLLIYRSGNGTWLLFLGVLVAFWLVSRSIGVFATRFASAGSLSAYAEAGLGRRFGSFAGWSYAVAMIFVVTSSGISVVYYLAMVISHFTAHVLGPAGLSALILGVVLLAWWPSYHDIKLSTKVMLVTEATSILLITVILGIAMHRSHQWVDRAQLHLEGTSFAKYQLGFVLTFMMLSGFESMTTLGEEAKTATSTLPRAMLFCLLPVSLFILACIYGLTAVSHRLNLALDQTAAPLDLVAQSIGHPTLGLLSSLAIAASCFGCALGGFNAGSRVLFSMGRGRQVWAYLGSVHPKNGTPYRALDLLAVIAVAVPVAMIYLGVTMADAMDYTLQLATFGFLGGYLAVCVAAPVYLAARAELKASTILTAVVTVAILGAVLVMTIVPVPTGTDRFLPYIFVGMIATGMMISRLSARHPPGYEPSAPDPKPAN